MTRIETERSEMQLNLMKSDMIDKRVVYVTDQTNQSDLGGTGKEKWTKQKFSISVRRSRKEMSSPTEVWELTHFIHSLTLSSIAAKKAQLFIHVE